MKLAAARAIAYGQQVQRAAECEIRYHTADDRREARQQVQRERASARESAVQQDRKVADFLRNLVRKHGERGHDPELRVGHVRGRDQHAVEHVVERVARPGSCVPSLHRACRGSASASRRVVVQ
jgi:hypothetical protein